MTTKINNNSQLTLAAVAEEFAKWRANKTKKTTKIPEYLWEKAVALLNFYRVSKISAALQLSGSQLNAKIRQINPNAMKIKANKAATRLATNKTIDFVELPKQTTTTAYAVIPKIAIYSIAGEKLCLESVSAWHVASIINCFLARN